MPTLGLKDGSEPRSSQRGAETRPRGVTFAVSEVNSAGRQSTGERERCERGGGAGGGGGGGAGNELNSGKLHLQGSPPVYNECV